MKAVLRVALASFSFVPLQRWLNIIGGGAAIVSLAVAFCVRASPLAVLSAGFISIVGMLLLVITPAVAGGVALRHASTRSQLHLRPYGRMRLLLAAALVVTAIAMLLTLPILVQQQLLPQLRGRTFLGLRITTLFASIWASVMLLWLGAFVTSYSRYVHILFATIPFGIGAAQMNLVALPISLFGLLTATLLCCAMFAVWFFRTDFVRRPDWLRDFSPIGMGNRSLLQRHSASLESRSALLRQYLMGSASPVSSLLSGLLVLGIMMLSLLLLLPNAELRHDARINPAVFMTPLGAFAITIPLSLVRRARLLWLRAGTDRAGLFEVVERRGLLGLALVCSVVMTGMLGVLVALHPELQREILAFGVAAIPMVLALFYLGLSLTHAWGGLDIAMTVLAVPAVLLVAMFSRPAPGTSISLVLGSALFALLLAVALRGYARRNWLQLDWLVVKLPQLKRQG